MKIINLKSILVFFLLLFSGVTLFSQILIESPPYDLLQEVPVVAFIPFAYSSGVGSIETEAAEGAIAKAMGDKMLFAPYSLDSWLGDIYSMEKARNLDAIAAKMKDDKFEVDYICHGSVFKSGRQYGLLVKMYPLDPGRYESYYFRYFSGLGSLSKYANQIVDEMAARVERDKAVENLFNKTIYIEKFIPKFLIFQKTSQGTYTISEVPFLTVNRVDYKNTDHFFNELFLYEIHKMRLFNLKTNNIDNYLVDEPQVPNFVDYIISGDIIISEKSTTLKILVIDNKSGSVLFDYEYPFQNLVLSRLKSVFHKNAIIIVSRLLDFEETRKVGFTTITAPQPGMPLVCNDYFMGFGTQPNLVLPVGLNLFKLGKKEYKRFVLPVSYSKYIGEESMISVDVINIVE